MNPALGNAFGAVLLRGVKEPVAVPLRLASATGRRALSLSLEEREQIPSTMAPVVPSSIPNRRMQGYSFFLIFKILIAQLTLYRHGKV